MSSVRLHSRYENGQITRQVDEIYSMLAATDSEKVSREMRKLEMGVVFSWSSKTSVRIGYLEKTWNGEGISRL